MKDDIEDTRTSRLGDVSGQYASGLPDRAGRRPGMLTTLPLLTALMLLWTPCLAAEEPTQSHQFSLQECLDTALRNNADALTARNSVVAAGSRSTSAKSSYFPQVSVQNNTFTWGSGDVLNRSTTGTALTVTQNVWDGGTREANARKARQDLTASSAGLARTLQMVSLNVKQAYYEVLRARHLQEVAEADVTYNEGLRGQITAQVGVGKSAKVDVLPVEAQLASARVSLLSAQNTVRTSTIALQTTMGIALQPGFGVQEADQIQDQKTATLNDLVNDATKSRQDLLQYQASTGAARASVSASRLALYPRPTITAEYQHQVSGGFTRSGSQMIGGISFDIFDGGANRAAYREAKANQADAEVRQQQLVKDIRAQVEQAYLNLANARERMDASAVSLEAAGKNYLAQKERYAQGLATTLDLLNAEVQNITAQSDSVQARYDYYIALAQLDYAVGK